MDVDMFVRIIIFATLLVAICRRVNQPSVLAYLILGMLVGPSGFAWLSVEHDIEVVAELGIVFLLFTIGLEISLKKLWSLRQQVFVVGCLQVVLTTVIPSFCAYLLGMSLVSAFIASCAVALSSTAIVIRLLQEQGELFSSHGQIALSLLLFQDIAAIPLLIIIPQMAAGGYEDVAMLATMGLVKGVMAFILVTLMSHALLVPLLRWVARKPTDELLLLVVLLIVCSSAWLTEQFGLSKIFGAFIAGAIMSETAYKHQLMTDIAPFRDMLLGLFFITIGMKLDFLLLSQHWYWVVWLAAMIFIFKTSLIFFIVRFLTKAASKTALMTGLILAHGGEFGIALLSVGMHHQLLEQDYGQVVLLGVIFSMILAPFIIKHAGAVCDYFSVDYRQPPLIPEITPTQRIIICGFGRVGQIVARLLQSESIPYTIIEKDRDKVEAAKCSAEPIFYGDAAKPALIDALGLMHTQMIVITFSDKRHCHAIITHVRRKNTNCYIMMRIQDETQAEYWLNQGVDIVVPEVQEIGLILSAHALLAMGQQHHVVAEKLWFIRQDHYQLNSRGTLKSFAHAILHPSLQEATFIKAVDFPMNHPDVGASLREFVQRVSPTITVECVQHRSGDYKEIDMEYRIQPGDSIFFKGVLKALVAIMPSVGRGRT